MEPGFYTPEKDVRPLLREEGIAASMEPGFYTPEKEDENPFSQ